jgi:hypothetical protein
MRHSRPFRKNPDIDEAPAAYQVRRAAKNSRKVLPMPGKSFSAQELQDLKAWFKARGADAVFAEGAGLRVIADVDNIDDVVPNYVHEKKLARSRLAQEARDAADRERRVETEKRLSESPAAAWVQRTFSAVNAFNKAALARYIDGTDKTFQGLLSGTFLEGALSLGFSEEQLRSWSGEELLKAIKHAYDASPRENPDDDAHVRFVYGARRIARGGFAPVVTQHGPGESAHEHGGWVAQGYDEDVALAVAKEHAEELASQYVGDWNIEIVSAEDEHIERQAERAAWQARHESGRANPRHRRNPSGPLVLFHGAHRWTGEPELRPAGKDKSNHGSGLYLTTSTDTAGRYAKGGGQVLRFEVQPLVFADEVRIPLETVVAFVKSLPRLKNKQAIVDDLRRYAARVGKDMMPAYVVENLMQNNDALKGAFGPALAAFFVEQGVDASLVTKGNEDWVVLYNLDKIESYRKATPAELLRDSPRVVR